MDNSQHWYIPRDPKAITSERMVSEIIMMNKLKIKAVLKYLKSGAMCWMVYLPADEDCDEEWIIALIYNKDFSMPGCKEPFTVMMAKPSQDQLIRAIEKGGHLKTDFTIPVNTPNKTDMTCVEAVENLMRWRKTIYKFLDFTPDVQPESVQEIITEPIKANGDEAVTERNKTEIKNDDESFDMIPEKKAEESEIIQVQEKKATEDQAIRSVDDILKNKRGIVNQSGAINIAPGFEGGAMKKKEIPAEPDGELITESPDEQPKKSYMLNPDTDDDDGEFVAAPPYSDGDDKDIFVTDVPLY